MAGVVCSHLQESWQGRIRCTLYVNVLDTFFFNLFYMYIKYCCLPTQITSLKVDPIIRGGIRRFTDMIGQLWYSLADYYIRAGHFEKVYTTSLCISLGSPTHTHTDTQTHTHTHYYIRAGHFERVQPYCVSAWAYTSTHTHTHTHTHVGTRHL